VHQVLSKGELNEDEYLLFAQNAEVSHSERRCSTVWKADAQNAEVPQFKHGSSVVCMDRTKKKAQDQPTYVPKASNTCLQVEKHPIIPKWNKFAHKNKTHASTNIPPSYVLRRNNLGKVVATYVGNQSNIYVKRSLWVPKVLVANVEGPKSYWGPIRRN
jgi:hypothetical protein